MLTPEQVRQYKAKYNLGTTSVRGAAASTPDVSMIEKLKASPLSASPEIQKRLQEAQKAGVEAERAASPLGQVKEFGKELGEISGITPTAKKIAGGIAPFVTPQEELPDVVEELAGGVETPQPGFAGELLETALDLPLISLGLSKTLARTALKQIPKLSGPAAQLLEKELSGFLPKALKKVMDIDVSTPIKGGLEKVKEGVGDIVEIGGKTYEKVKTTLFGKAPQPAKNVDEIINQADESLKPSKIRAATEQGTAIPSLKEKWAGISPDIKNRIAGKSDKLKEYFDVAHARNNYDTLPTPLEHGVKRVDEAVTKMETVLNDTGSQIGAFRKKVSTYQANIDDVAQIDKTFGSELLKLNLQIVDGVVQKIPGKVSRVNSDAEIKLLNDLYSELLTVKQNPNLEKLIDLRNLFDSRISFERSLREVSNSIDPVSRAVRKQIADISAKIVGKSEAKNLAKYSEFIDAYNSLKSFTDRKAGAEFLLKQVLSERGRSPREVMRTIKDITGIDLMDDAVMSSLATDLIGNTRQKGLFRQEITKAGLDASSVLKGDVSGALNLMLDWGKKALINEEKIFLKAAGAK